jgi:hypothetical protein
MHNNTGHMVCFIFLHDFRWEKVFALLNIQGVGIEKRGDKEVGVHAKYLLRLSDFN